MRLVPRSLAGQLIALLLIALVLSQVVTIFILLDERHFVLRAADRDQVLARSAVLVRLLEETPPHLHEGVLAAARSPRLDFSLSDRSAVSGAPANRVEQGLAQRLQELIGNRRETRVRLLSREPWSPRDWHEHRRWGDGETPRRGREDFDDDDGDDEDEDYEDHEADDDEDRRHSDKRRGHGPISLIVSVSLTNGDWLNAQNTLSQRPRALVWAWFPVLSMGIMALAILAIVILSLRRITRPLRELSAAADRFGRGESQPPLAERGPVEVRRTTKAFNAMQERLTRFVQDRTQMLAAIGHDLRTPITSLRLRAEFVEDAETRQKILDTLDEMTRMTEAAIRFARDDAAAEETRRVDLIALIGSLVDDLADQGHAVTFEVKKGLAERLDYSCRSTSIKRVLHNLIDNALRYANQARVHLDVAADQVIITVEDSGPGIPEDKLDQVFEPFVRLEESRSQETGGVGLGLAIARSIAHAHGGALSLANRPEGGLRAVLALPIGTAADA